MRFSRELYPLQLTGSKHTRNTILLLISGTLFARTARGAEAARYALRGPGTFEVTRAAFNPGALLLVGGFPSPF